MSGVEAAGLLQIAPEQNDGEAEQNLRLNQQKESLLREANKHTKL